MSTTNTTNTTTIAGAFERQTWGVDYVRPQDSLLREAGGELVASSNDNGSYSHSPTEMWEFPDGSRLRVTCSDCGECRKWRVVIANAFSLNMLTLGVGGADLQIHPIPPGVHPGRDRGGGLLRLHRRPCRHRRRVFQPAWAGHTL